MVLGPFGRPQQPRLLGVPRGIDDRAPRPIPSPRQLAHRLRLREQTHHPAQRVGRAEHPGVVMIAADHPLIGKLASLQPRDHVVRRPQAPVELELQMHRRRTGTDVIRDRQRTTPRTRRHLTADGLHQRQRVGVTQRQHRNLHDRGTVLDREALRVLRRAAPRRERITRIGGHVRHRPALRPVLHPVRPCGVHIPLPIPVVPRIRIQNAPHGAVFRGHLGLDPAPRAAVPRDHDLPLHTDPAPLQLLVVRRNAVVDVDQLGRHIPVARVGVVGRQPPVDDSRGRVFFQYGLGESRHEVRGLHQLDHARDRRGIEHVEHLDLDLVSPAPEKPSHPLGIFACVRRAHVIRRRRHAPVPRLLLARIDQPVQTPLDFSLPLCVLCGKPQDAVTVRLGCDSEQQNDGKGWRQAAEDCWTRHEAHRGSGGCV